MPGVATSVAVPAGAGVMSDRTAANPVLPMSFESTAKGERWWPCVGIGTSASVGGALAAVPCRSLPVLRTLPQCSRFGSGT